MKNNKFEIIKTLNYIIIFIKIFMKNNILYQKKLFQNNLFNLRRYNKK